MQLGFWQNIFLFSRQVQITKLFQQARVQLLRKTQDVRVDVERSKNVHGVDKPNSVTMDVSYSFVWMCNWILRFGFDDFGSATPRRNVLWLLSSNAPFGAPFGFFVF